MAGCRSVEPSGDCDKKSIMLLAKLAAAADSLARNAGRVGGCGPVRAIGMWGSASPKKLMDLFYILPFLELSDHSSSNSLTNYQFTVAIQHVHSA